MIKAPITCRINDVLVCLDRLAASSSCVCTAAPSDNTSHQRGTETPTTIALRTSSISAPP